MKHPAKMYISVSGLGSLYCFAMLDTLDTQVVSDARFEAPGVCLYNGKLEKSTVLHIITPVSAEELFDIWDELRLVDTYRLRCAWVEWGEYAGCIKEIK